MDPVTALGVAAAVAQFLNLGFKVVKTLNEYINASPGDMPKALKSITVQLPLLLNALSRIQSESNISRYDDETQLILHGVAVGCLKLSRELDDISVKLRPRPGETLASKLKKTLSSLKIEERVLDIDRGLQGYVQVLILHQVVDRADFPSGQPEEAAYFEISEKQIQNHTPRADCISQLDTILVETVQGQNDKPTFVILEGDNGFGKSELALEYCHLAYAAGQFRTVFWLNASSPNSLRLGLENAASIVRRNRTGTTKEKLDFFNKFLFDRWHPWLLVLDGYEKSNFATEPVLNFLPENGHGAIMVTTRDRGAVTWGQILRVPKFRTEHQMRDQRRRVTEAIRSKDLSYIKSALAEGLSVNSLSCDGWGDERAPILNVAAEAGFDDAVKLLLDQGADLHFKKSWSSALTEGVRSGSLSIVSLLLDREERTAYPFEDMGYDSAFSALMERGNLIVLRHLIERRGARFEPDGSLTGPAFKTAAYNGHLEVLRFLHSHGKFPTKLWLSAYALSESIKRENLEMVTFLVSEAHLDPNVYGYDPALISASEVESSTPNSELRDAIVSRLLASGADPNLGTRNHNRSPLSYAAMYGQVSTTALLLKSGAKPEAEDQDQDTPLLSAIRSEESACFEMLLDVDIMEEQAYQRYFGRAMFAAINNDDRNLAFLLAQKKGIVNAIDPKSQDTPLLAAIKKGSSPMARMLLKKGASQEIKDKEGKRPLLVAAEQGLDLVVRDLAIAEDTRGLGIKDKMGNTPLHLAVKGQHRKCVKALLTLGADEDAENMFGETAMNIAEDSGDEEIVKLLL